MLCGAEQHRIHRELVSIAGVIGRFSIYRPCVLPGGAKEIRTPDLLQAIQTRTVAGCGQMSLCMPFTCGDSGWTWPYVAWRLASLAPNLAPRKLISSANIRWSTRSPNRPSAGPRMGYSPIQHHWYGRARLVLTHGEASSPENSTRIRTPGSCPAYCGEVGRDCKNNGVTPVTGRTGWFV